MKRAATAAAAMASRVCFLTDVEGNWQYVRRFVRQSTCLRFRDAAEHELALQDDDCVLVFGGDAGDKGDDTLHCYEQLVRLKREHPDRVVLLVGNRDVNKMRFTSELHDSEMDLAAMAKEIRDGPVWVPQDKRMTVTSFLQKKAAEASVTCEATIEATHAEIADIELLAPALAAVNTKENRLEWMLNYTMGSQGDFERRRNELSTKATTTTKEISDDAVVHSFTSSVEDGGVVREFLLQGCLAVVLHNTLFVHGGLITTTRDGEIVSSLGRVPGDSTVYDDVHEWTRKLNAWYQQQLREWIDQPTWSPDRSTRGGHELMEYVLPFYHDSVIMGRHVDKAGMPVALPASVAASLRASGITRVVVGHTPHGTCPTVIRQPVVAETGDCIDNAKPPFEEVIMCDTSYSDMAAPDNRGAAASELVLHSDGRVDIHGELDDGRRIAFATNSSTSDGIIGRLLRDGTRVKAQLVDDDGRGRDQYLVFKVENGFSYTYHDRSRAEMDGIGFVDE